MKKTSASIFALATAQITILAPFAQATTASQIEADWDLIRSVDIQEIVTDTTYEVRKSFPEKLENGISQFNLTGFVTLTYTDQNVQEFILVSDMGFCPYCGDPDHGASIQVKLADIENQMIDGERITVIGNLTPIKDSQTWQSLILKDALILR